MSQDLPSLRRATALEPQHADAWIDLGVALRSSDLAGSEAAFRQAIALDPRSPQAHSGLGLTLKAQGRCREAVEAFGRSLRADPGQASAFNNLGNTLAAMGRDTPALMAYRAALRRDPGHADAQSNLGVLLRRMGRTEEALQAFRRAVDLAPTSATAAFNLANGLAGEAREEAGAAYQRAIELKPGWPSAHLNYALWLLREGRYEEGWAEYEWRWAKPGARALAERLSLPRWTADQPAAGKVILITGEQGLGDAIQCARYFPMLAALGATVLVEAKPQLRELLAGAPGVARVVSRGEWIEHVDYQCPIFSLPFAFKTTLATVPAAVPYLHPPQALIDDWAARLPSGPRIGLAWQGNPTSRADKGRSFPLVALQPLAGRAAAAFVSLQKDHGLDQLADGAAGFPILDLGQPFQDGSLLTTAAIVANLDLVIACDSAVAHLAGALGRPVWIVLKHRSEWRWLRGRSDSPWYPSARLYRQSRDGDWQGAFAALAEDLAARFPVVG